MLRPCLRNPKHRHSLHNPVCLEIPLQSSPPPGHRHLVTAPPPPPGRPSRATPGLCKGGEGSRKRQQFPTGKGFNQAVKKFVWTNFEALPRTKYFIQFLGFFVPYCVRGCHKDTHLFFFHYDIHTLLLQSWQILMGSVVKPSKKNFF